jgi:hypothetical protein
LNRSGFLPPSYHVIFTGGIPSPRAGNSYVTFSQGGVPSASGGGPSAVTRVGWRSFRAQNGRSM